MPAGPDRRLSFTNIIEAHVLKALRTRHSVPVKAVRSALDYAQAQMGIERLLIRPELRTSAGELFLERYGELINLSRAGQLVMKRILEAHLERVEWDANLLPARLFPFPKVDMADVKRAVVIDPFVAFGRPTVAGRGIATGTIADRVNSGESPEEVAADYGLDSEQVQEALVYELAA
jgi:uncharacterized protein (DUF433 family)